MNKKGALQKRKKKVELDEICEIYSDVFWFTLQRWEFYRRYDFGNSNKYQMFFGIVVNKRYTVKSLIRQESFGEVYEAFDARNRCTVAVKIASNPMYNKTSRREAELIRMMNRSDHSGNRFIVELLDYFTWNNVTCLILEKLALNLYAPISIYVNKGLSLNFISKCAEQLLKALAFLLQINVVHCNIKPSNIFIRNIGQLSIKLTDFGISVKGYQKVSKRTDVQFYKAPDILLKYSCSHDIDMWSVACVLVELCTARPLFSGSDDVDQVNKIVEVLGMPPKNMLEDGTRSKTFFKKKKSKYILRSVPKRFYRAPGTRRLPEILSLHFSGIWRRKEVKYGLTISDYFKFTNLILKMLKYDPKLRIKPDEALNHIFIKSDSQINPVIQEQIQNFMKNSESLPSVFPSEMSSSLASLAPMRYRLASTSDEDDDWTSSSSTNSSD